MRTAGPAPVAVLTGASGFIGRQCIPHLIRQGFVVHALARGAPPPEADGAIWHQVDLSDESRVAALLDRVAPSHLLHTAWCKPGPGWSSPENAQWVDISLKVVDRFAQAGGARIVVTGSCAEYDWRFDTYPESTPLAPTTVYGQCKVALYRQLMARSGAHGMSTGWGRVFFVYGPGEDPVRLVSSATLSMLRGEPARCSHGRQIRDWLYSSDVASGLVALLESDITDAVNIAAGAGHSVREVVSTLAEQIGRPDLPVFGALPSGPDEPPSIVAEVSRVTNELGWRPQFGLAEGLARTIDDWRGRLALAEGFRHATSN